jgi:hypothetical protein
VLDLTLALVQVEAIEVAGESQTVGLWWAQHQLARSEAVETNGRKGDLTGALTVVEVDDDVGADLPDDNAKLANQTSNKEAHARMAFAFFR